MLAAPQVAIHSPSNASLARIMSRGSPSTSSLGSARTPSPAPRPAAAAATAQVGPLSQTGTKQPPHAQLQPPTPNSALPSPTKSAASASDLVATEDDKSTGGPPAEKAGLAPFHPSRLQAIPPFKPKPQRAQTTTAIPTPAAPTSTTNTAAPSAVPRHLSTSRPAGAFERRSSTGHFPSVLAPATSAAEEESDEGAQGLGIVGVEVIGAKKRRSSAMEHIDHAREATQTLELEARSSSSRPSSAGSQPTSATTASSASEGPSPSKRPRMMDPFASLLTAASSALAPTPPPSDDAAALRAQQAASVSAARRPTFHRANSSGKASSGPSSNSSAQQLTDALTKLERSKNKPSGQLGREKARHLTIITQQRRASMNPLDAHQAKTAPIHGGQGMSSAMPSVLVAPGAVSQQRSPTGTRPATLKPAKPTAARRPSSTATPPHLPQGGAYPSVMAGGHAYPQTAHPASSQHAHYVHPQTARAAYPQQQQQTAPPSAARRSPPQPYAFPGPPQQQQPQPGSPLRNGMPSPPQTGLGGGSGPVSKQQFLGLFSTFFDSLADSRVLARSLDEQTRKAGSLLHALGEAGKVFEDVMDRRLDAFADEHRAGLQRIEERMGALEARLDSRTADDKPTQAGIDTLLRRLDELERKLDAKA